MTEQEIQRNFPTFHDQELLDQIMQVGRETYLNAGEELMKQGQYIKSIPLVMEGRIRISRQDGEGGEVFLYFLSEGQTCAMSLSCCMADKKSSIMAVAEEPCRMITIPVQYMDDWMLRFPTWKNFIMQTYGERFNELLEAFDAVAFLRMDERLMKYLLDRQKAESSDVLHISHHEIAQELHTSREVISRLLKRLENDGIVQLGRNRIELTTKIPVEGMREIK